MIRLHTVKISIHEVFADLDGFFVRNAWYQDTFQSTRSSQTSTSRGLVTDVVGADFNPRGLRRPRRNNACSSHCSYNFNPRGLRRPRPRQVYALKPFQLYFNPRGLRRPRRSSSVITQPAYRFQSTRSSQTSTPVIISPVSTSIFQSTRSSQTSTGSPSNIFHKSIFQSTRSSQTSTWACVTARLFLI